MNMKALRGLPAALLVFALAAGPALAEGQRESAAQPAGPVELDVWITAAVSESAPPPADWIGYRVIREKLGIDLKVSFLPSNFTDSDTRINTAAAANNLPDLLAVNPDTLLKLAQAGLLAPVDDLIGQMPHRQSYYDDPVRRQMVTVKGRMYGFPEMGAIPQREGLVIRQDWLDRLGLKAPKTIDEFYAVARAFTEKDPDSNGRADTYGFGAYIDQRQLHEAGLGYRFDPIFGAYGVCGFWNVESLATFGINARKPEFLQALQAIRKMVEAGVIDPDWPTVKKDEFRARWKQGKFGIMREAISAGELLITRLRSWVKGCISLAVHIFSLGIPSVVTIPSAFFT